MKRHRKGEGTLAKSTGKGPERREAQGVVLRQYYVHQSVRQLAPGTQPRASAVDANVTFPHWQGEGQHEGLPHTPDHLLESQPSRHPSHPVRQPELKVKGDWLNATTSGHSDISFCRPFLLNLQSSGKEKAKVLSYLW